MVKKTVDLVIVHDDLEVGDDAKVRCHDVAAELCESIGANDDIHVVNCQPHEIEKAFTYVGPEVIAEDSVYYCGQYVYDVHPDEVDTLEAILDKIDNADSKLHVSQNHHDYGITSRPFGAATTCTDNNSDLWHLKAMNPDGMNNFRSNQGFDGEGTIAYIIDTGVNEHVDFGDRLVGGWNIVDNNDNFGDIHGHGSHVAGSVAGTTTGVAPNALIWGVQVFYYPSSGGGPFTGDGYVGDALERIVNKVTANGEKAVVNMSLGGRGQSGAYQRIIDAAIAAGVNIVVAAGNDNEDACNFSPAYVDSAITVGAYGKSGSSFRWAYFSNWGSCVDISAPGMAIRGPQHNNRNGFVEMQGTSMAAPHVAGVVATIMSRTGISNPQTVKWMLLGGEYSADLSNIVANIPDGTTPLFAMQPCIEAFQGDIPTGPPDGVPVITTTTAAPIVTDLFTLAGGSDCTVSENCVSTVNWPSAYGNDQECMLTITEDVTVAVDSNFELEARYDVLEINNVDIRTATSVPTSLADGSTIEWSTDRSVTRRGWQLCFSASGSPPGPSESNQPTQAPLTAAPTIGDFVSPSQHPAFSEHGTSPPEDTDSPVPPTDVPDTTTTSGSGGTTTTSGSGGTTTTPTSWPTMGTMPATNVPDTTEAPPATTESPTSWPTVPATTTAGSGAMFSVSGSGCTTTSSCVSSKNYPSRYGNRQSCTVTMSRSVRLDVQSPFEIERNYDYLRVDGSAKWSSSSIPSTLNVGGTIAWSTDGSVTKYGWKICFTANDGGDVPPPVEENGPTRTCSDVYSYERSNDWLPWCTVSSGPLSSGTLISFSMSWKDQGWGYQKGKVALVETIAGEEDPLAHFQTDRAPHSRSTYTGSYTLTQDVDNLEFRYRVGGGGGHRIYINDFQYTMTEPEDDGAFSMNMVELDMTEAESLAWKQAKDDTVHEMKVQQLKEQIKLEAEIAAREYSMVQEVIFNPLLIEVFAFIGAVSIVGAVVRKGMEYRNKGDYINIEQEI